MRNNVFAQQNSSSLDVTDFKIVWNNSAINTVCPICGNRTEPSIHFQVQTSDGADICEDCLLEHATDLAEVLYAYFLYKYPNDQMTVMTLDEIKNKQTLRYVKPNVLSYEAYDQVRSLTDSVSLFITTKTDAFNNEDISSNLYFLVSKKWLIQNYPSLSHNRDKNSYFQEQVVQEEVYQKAIHEGAVIAEYLK